jgi:hypothetical protein
MGHTPGPWRVNVFLNVLREKLTCQMAVHQLGPSLPILEATFFHCGSVDECAANAHLIASAPELLAALKNITEDYAERFDLDSESTNPGIKSSIEQARAAIAKAEGANSSSIPNS